MVTEAKDDIPPEVRAIMEGNVFDVRLLAMAIGGNATQQATAKSIIRRKLSKIEYPFMEDIFSDSPSKFEEKIRVSGEDPEPAHVRLAMEEAPTAHLSLGDFKVFKQEKLGSRPVYSSNVVETLRAEVRRLQKLVNK